MALGHGVLPGTDNVDCDRISFGLWTLGGQYSSSSIWSISDFIIWIWAVPSAMVVLDFGFRISACDIQHELYYIANVNIILQPPFQGGDAS